MSGCVVRACGWQDGIEENYLAVNPTGEIVTLYRTDSTKEDEDNSIIKVAERGGFDGIQCMGYSKVDVGLTAVGQLDGTAHIFDINSSQVLLDLKPKQARPCNSISFNDNGMVLLGYDRGRQDHSIQVWDLRHFSRSGNNDHINKPLITYVPNEVILSASFCPFEPNNFLSGSYKLLREFDIRANQPVYQISTKCTLNISADPFNSYVFASHSEDGTLALWDRRKLVSSYMSQMSGSGITSASSNVITEGPVLVFNKLLNEYQRKSGGSPFRFSSINKGEFAALFDGDLIRRWRIGTSPPSLVEIAKYESYQSQTKTDSQNHTPKVQKPTDSFFVAKVSDVRTKYERVISFDYSPSNTAAYGLEFVCMRQSGSVYKMSVTQSQSSIAFNSFNDISFSGPHGTCSKMVKDIVQEQTDISHKKIAEFEAVDPKDHRRNSVNLNGKRYSTDSRMNEKHSFLSDEDDDESYMDKDGNDNDEDQSIFIEDSKTLLTSDVLLENDICATIRRRAMLNYGVDADRNMHILETSVGFETQLQLRNTWKWISISYDLVSSGKMVANDFDFSYLGVLGIWNISLGFTNYNRYNGPDKTSASGAAIQAAKQLIERRAQETKKLAVPLIGFRGKSNKEVERRFCMYVIGWDFGLTDLEERYTSLIEKDEYERAAAFAVFHGDISKAVEILSNSKHERLRIMSTAVAGYFAFGNIQDNNTWKDQCRKLSSDLDNPYLRVLFAYIADNNWWDVLDETGLSLRERLGVALRFLPDNELDMFLNKIAENVIATGEIEGIILTGITQIKGLKLLQSFVDRTGDIQTASLISSYACPRFFRDERVESWVHNYRTLLNSWNLFAIRAKFDVSRTRLSKGVDGRIQTTSMPPQVHLQCSKCHKNITSQSKTSTNNRMNVGAHGMPSKYGTKFSQSSTGHSCPHCGYPLPRCAICLIAQGVPIPKESHYIDYADEVPKAETEFKSWFSFCLSCNHGMHAGHAEEWFSKHYVCPVPDCNCKCNSK